MRKLAIIIFSLVVAFSALHLANMAGMFSAMDGAHFTTMQEAMPDCPMGDVCPLRFHSVDFTAAQPGFKGWLMLFATLAVFAAVLLPDAFQAGSPPLAVAANVGPFILRSTIKRE